MLIGLEKEYFLLDAKGNPVGVLPPLNCLPADECGWLVEARGKPFSSITEAVFSLKADIHKIEQEIVRLNGQAAALAAFDAPLTLSDQPIMRIPRSVRLAVSRAYAKPPIQYQNLYGYLSHRNAVLDGTAGVHISFTEPREVETKDSKRTFNVNFDWAHIFHTLDVAFENEIAAARRRPGFYELKRDGRIEYRSLPSNVDLEKLISVLLSNGFVKN